MKLSKQLDQIKQSLELQDADGQSWHEDMLKELQVCQMKALEYEARQSMDADQVDDIVADLSAIESDAILRVSAPAEYSPVIHDYLDELCETLHKFARASGKLVVVVSHPSDWDMELYDKGRYTKDLLQNFGVGDELLNSVLQQIQEGAE